MVTSEHPRFGLMPTGPAYDVAIEQAKRLYPEALQVWNIIRRFQVYLPGVFPCDAASVEMQAVAGRMTAMVGQLEGFTVLLCPGEVLDNCKQYFANFKQLRNFQVQLSGQKSIEPSLCENSEVAMPLFDYILNPCPKPDTSTCMENERS
ncbi:hypothetical protein BV898_04977 [Hypsibius exemplaris]|uniref:Uncharacterized protein n=1 Tax=Hypsibius exemplaris TaxID=2072580 RepID=A0A1W0X188_HYPEX|nr:hypothetical protein BV898_04977 [Hypsibius exemplaris]